MNTEKENTATAPDPSSIDLRAKRFLELKEKVLQAKLAVRDAEQQMSAEEELLKEWGRKYGGAHAEKSKLLHGLAYEVMVTFGQTVSMDGVAVEALRTALQEQKQTRLLKKIFEQTVRWTLNPQASEIVRSSRLSDKLRSLFARCQVVKERAPSLTVRLKERAA